MREEELKEKYKAYINDVSGLLGLGKPIDILKLCIITDAFFLPLQKCIEELEEENAEENAELKRDKDQLTKAKDIIKRLMHELVVSNRPYNEVELLVKDVEQFLKED